jgi:hypothetical protein
MRLAHLILVHSNPLQTERLVKRLLFDKTDVYIHLDKKSDITEFLYLADLENVFFINKRTAIAWGDYSMVDATLKSFEEILSSDVTYSHINLLSGQDYPLKSASVIQKFLLSNADKTFMKYRSIYDEWEESVSRLTKYNLGDYNFPFKWKIQDLLNKILPARKMPKKLKPYGFSQWITITPVCINYVIEYLKKNPSVTHFFKMTWAVDEIIFQTILLNSPLKDCIVNDHLRYIKFTKKAARPKTLTMEDAEILLKSDKFYARKFSLSEDSRIFDFLDRIAEVPAHL